MHRELSKGFTLMELLIAVAVVGVMSSIAIPQFTKTRERGTQRACLDILRTIYAGEQAFKALDTTSKYKIGLNNASADADWWAIYVDNPHTPTLRVDFFVVAGGTGNSGSFRAYAQRQGTTDCAAINEARVLCPGAGCPGAPPNAPCTAWWNP